MCGLSGSGKTTLARELEEAEGLVRFTLDEWMIALYGHHMPRDLLHARLNVLKELHWSVARRLLELDVGVILDFGFWWREERERFGARVRAAGGEPVLYHFDVPEETLLERLAARNLARPEGVYEVTPEMLRRFATWFEPPEESEGVRVVRIVPEGGG